MPKFARVFADSAGWIPPCPSLPAFVCNSPIHVHVTKRSSATATWTWIP